VPLPRGGVVVTPPLAGHDARILELLEAGRSFDDVCEIGRYRRSWRPSDVHRIENWRTKSEPREKAKPRGRPPVPGERRGRPAGPIPHGEDRGYALEQLRGIPHCDACRTAHSEAGRRRRKAA
jgi:hypothetical protein